MILEFLISINHPFIALRKSVAQFSDLREQLVELRTRLGEHDVQLNKIYEAIENLLDDKTDKELKETAWKNRKRIGFKN